MGILELSNRKRKILFSCVLVSIVVLWPSTIHEKRRKKEQIFERSKGIRTRTGLTGRCVEWWYRAGRWRLALSTVTIFYILSNLLVIMGFARRVSLAEQHYSPSFQRIRRLLTGLDAGIISCISIKQKLLRDVLSLVLGAWYVVFNAEGEQIMHRFHTNPSILGIRRCWTKGRHPVLWAVSQAKETCQVKIHRRPITIYAGSHAGDKSGTTHPILSYLYFQGSDLTLRTRVSRVILNFPGGGFVTMNPKHHECYLRKWADMMPDCVIISVDYRKAPEFPYPHGFNDAFDVYRAIVKSNGKCLGLDLSRQGRENERLRIALSGDSAGGNFAAGVALRAIGEGLQIPDGVLLAYPSLDMDINLLRVGGFQSDFERTNSTNTSVLYPLVAADMFRADETPLLSGKDGQHDYPAMKHNSRVSMDDDDQKHADQRRRRGQRGRHSEIKKESDRNHQSNSGGSLFLLDDIESRHEVLTHHSGDDNNKHNNNKVSLSNRRRHLANEIDYSTHSRGNTEKMTAEGVHSQLNSHAQFFSDGVLPMSYSIIMSDAYLNTDSADPANDPFISPLHSPRCLLRYFPCCRIHVGSVDPLVDDSRRFVARLREYCDDPDVEIVEYPGLSHAYMQTPPDFLHESLHCMELSVKWLSLMLCSDLSNTRFKSVGKSAL